MSLKKIKKLSNPKCYFCGLEGYELVEAHRIHEGKNGGKYTWENILNLCPTCHTKVHLNKIKILGNHYSTRGWVLNYIDENGQEIWREH